MRPTSIFRLKFQSDSGARVILYHECLRNVISSGSRRYRRIPSSRHQVTGEAEVRGLAGAETEVVAGSSDGNAYHSTHRESCFTSSRTEVPSSDIGSVVSADGPVVTVTNSMEGLLQEHVDLRFHSFPPNPQSGEYRCWFPQAVTCHCFQALRFGGQVGFGPHRSPLHVSHTSRLRGE